MAYGPEGFNRLTFREFLAPVEATARLCGMTFNEPWVVAGTHAMTPAAITQAADGYAALIRRLGDR